MKRDRSQDWWWYGAMPLLIGMVVGWTIIDDSPSPAAQIKRLPPEQATAPPAPPPPSADTSPEVSEAHRQMGIKQFVGIEDLLKRIAALEKSLSGGVPDDHALSPAQTALLQSEYLKQEQAGRQAKILRYVNLALVTRMEGGVAKVYEPWLKPKDDPLVGLVLDSYRSLGWQIEYVPGLTKEGNGYYTFALPARDRPETEPEGNLSDGLQQKAEEE